MLEPICVPTLKDYNPPNLLSLGFGSSAFRATLLPSSVSTGWALGHCPQNVSKQIGITLDARNGVRAVLADLSRSVQDGGGCVVGGVMFRLLVGEIDHGADCWLGLGFWCGLQPWLLRSELR